LAPSDDLSVLVSRTSLRYQPIECFSITLEMIAFVVSVESILAMGRFTTVNFGKLSCKEVGKGFHNFRNVKSFLCDAKTERKTSVNRLTTVKLRLRK
jgi:hypothetical protein